MIIRKITIDQGQWLEDVIEQIETNSIYFKTLTGIGATSLELKTARNSIIVEPNVPVIDGKKGIGILGIKERITTDVVMQFMENKKFAHKKLIVTPESFYKVMDAANNLNINIYKEYFLLFDECDRLVKDAKFRKKIILPMEDFFKFKNKTMISATAIWPSDPRFVKEGFIKQVIVPTFDYKESIKLIGTTNVNQSLENCLKNISAESDEDKFFIFFNSVKEPERFISQLKIGEESILFCSKDASLKLLNKNSYEVKDTVVGVQFKKYNFFTSRFFSAMDIKVADRPHVVLVSNLIASPHSKIDPESEAKQIIGRLRNGVSSITAISNVDPEIEYFTPEESRSYLKGCEDCYEILKTLYMSATQKGAKAAISEALSLISYARFINEDGSLNHYLIDEFIMDEKVKSFYSSLESLKKGYDNHYFNVDYSFEEFPIGDKQLDPLEKAVTYKDRVQSVTAILRDIENLDRKMKFTINNGQDVYQALERSFPEIVKAYMLLGDEMTNKIGYSKKALEKALKTKEKEGQSSSYGLIDEIYEEFEIGEKLSGTTIKAKLKVIIDKLDLDYLQPQINLLERFFQIRKRNDLQGKDAKKFHLVRKKI